MKKLILLNILLNFSLFAQSNQLTLEQSLEIGLKNSKNLKISQSKVIGAEAKRKEAGSFMLPKLSFGASYTRLSEVDPFQVTVPFSPVPIKIQDAVLNNYNFGLTVQQPLFTGLRLYSQWEAAKYNIKAQEAEYTKDINEEASKIQTAFWNFYKTQKILNLINDNLSALEKHLNDTKNFADNGLATKNDYLKIEVQFSNLKLKKIDAENNVNLARVNFNRSIGIELDKQTEIFVNETQPIITEYKYENLLNEAFDSREELKSLDYRIKSGEKGVTAANSGWLPSIYLFGHFYYNNPNQRTMPLKDEFNETWDVGVSLNWDIWDWGNTSSKAIQAEQQLIQMQTSLEQLKETIQTEVYYNYLKLISENQKVEVSRLTVNSAEENYRITKEKYSQQLATSTDLIDAETDLLNAQTQLTTSFVDLELAKIGLEKSVGRKVY